VHTIVVNNISAFQSFGPPFSICDEDAIDIVYGDMLREDFEITEPVNYSAMAVMPSELLVISKAAFT